MGRSISAVILAGAWVSSWRPQIDEDAWWHVAYGRVIVESGAIPPVERFSWLTEGSPLFLHSWAWDVLLSWADRLGGPTGMSILGLPFLAAVVGLLWLVIGSVAPDIPPIPRASLVLSRHARRPRVLGRQGPDTRRRVRAGDRPRHLDLPRAGLEDRALRAAGDRPALGEPPRQRRAGPRCVPRDGARRDPARATARVMAGPIGAASCRGVGGGGRRDPRQPVPVPPLDVSARSGRGERLLAGDRRVATARPRGTGAVRRQAAPPARSGGALADACVGGASLRHPDGGGLDVRCARGRAVRPDRGSHARDRRRGVDERDLVRGRRGRTRLAHSRHPEGWWWPSPRQRSSPSSS